MKVLSRKFHFNKSAFVLKLLGFAFFTLFYCEFLHYYITIVGCRWPHVGSVTPQEDVVRAMVVADTHLLGSRNGHWFDKLRREWQMERAFKTAVFVHSPDVVIFLGDLFDEGKWCGTEEFRAYVARFSRLFAVPSSTQLIIVAGNHDMGFHYSINPSLAGRFESAFNVSSVNAVVVRGVLFVGVNSMALHGDDCFLCSEASDRLQKLNKELACRRGVGPCPVPSVLPPTGPLHTLPQPVLLQHYPLYRPSDEHCDGYDAAPPEVRPVMFRERWECLSQPATFELLSLLEPMFVLSGHTHHGCTTLHHHPPPAPEAPQVGDDPVPHLELSPEEAEYAAEERDYLNKQQAAAAKIRGDVDEPLIIPEYSVPSFSWRNKKNPTFAMVSISGESHGLYRCEMPREQTVVLLYCASCCVFLLSFVRRKLWWLAPLYTALFRRSGS